MLATVPYTTGPYTGSPASFLYTPTSLLPEHSVLTDVQQATGRNGQQWITCRSGGEGTRPEIWMGSELVVNSSTANSATIGLGTQHPNGLYHCLSGQSQREYFSLYLSSTGKRIAFIQMHTCKLNRTVLYVFRAWHTNFTEQVQLLCTAAYYVNLITKYFILQSLCHHPL